MFPKNGFIEPSPTDDDADNEMKDVDSDGFPKIKNNRVYPLPPPPPTPPSLESVEASSPPSYDCAMAQERVQRRLIGDLLQKTSHLFGMHPFRAKIICKEDFCQKLKFRDRIRISDLILCIINLLVVLNHLRLGLYKCSESGTSTKFSNQTLEATLHIIEAALPLACIIGMMYCSYYMNNLLQALTDIHCRLFPNRHIRRVKFWRYVLYVINGFFVFATIMELPQNFLIELRKPDPNISESYGFSDFYRTPLGHMPSTWDKIVVFLDRYYFPLINFGVVKVPQLFIMMIAIRIAVMFRENKKILQKTTVLTRQILESHFSQLMEIINVLNLLDLCFDKLIVAILTTSVIKIIFTSYGTLREIFSGVSYGSTGIMSIIHEMEMSDRDDDSFIAILIMLNSTCSVFGVLLNIFWTILFIVPCIVCNELSRSALSVITSKLVADDAKNTKDQIVQKLMDQSWGLTLGGFFRIDRAFAMTLVSAIFTIVVVWLQLTVPSFVIN
uniref:Gustatory receptor n=1 Tax=Panagrolaimus sp. PS1159 TaxID=55785 RepID=A0AC35FIJ5_9BILA